MQLQLEGDRHHAAAPDVPGEELGRRLVGGVFGPGAPLALRGSPGPSLAPREPGWQVGGQPPPVCCWVCSQLLSAQFGP